MTVQPTILVHRANAVAVGHSAQPDHSRASTFASTASSSPSPNNSLLIAREKRCLFYFKCLLVYEYTSIRVYAYISSK